MSAVVLPAASAAFTSTQVIFSNSTRSACARGSARADPAASIREAVPPAINISKECETEPMRMSFSFPQKHAFLSTLMHDRKLHKFIILTIIIPGPHVSVMRRRRFRRPLVGRFTCARRVRPAGSIAGAAHRLFRTPSAITRQVQRLEAALGAELLDRSVKPPRLNSLGSRVLEQARDLLQRTEALKSLTSSDAEPHGLLRIGLSHALAEGTLIEPIQALTFVQGAAGNLDGDWKSFGGNTTSR